jgi:hypothetical protein
MLIEHLPPRMPIPMPCYLKVIWHHRLAEEPVELFSEVDDNRMELRKVDVYRDGRHDFANHARSTGTTRLSEGPLPSVEEIAAQPEFTPAMIDAAEFEKVWLRATER